MFAKVPPRRERRHVSAKHSLLLGGCLISSVALARNLESVFVPVIHPAPQQDKTPPTPVKSLREHGYLRACSEASSHGVPSWQGRHLFAAAAFGAMVFQFQSGGRSRRTARAAAPTGTTQTGSASTKGDLDFDTVLDIVKAVLLAVLDIFKEPPKESTGRDAPGLVALGSGGILGALSGCSIQNVRDGTVKDASEVASGAVTSSSGATTGRNLIVFATHFGDFNSWEEAQQLRTAVREGRLGGASVALIGIGSVESGKKFAEFLELPPEIAIFADPVGACHQALGFSKGALPQYAAQLNPYFRVFLMLLGVGSPGTIRTVLGGYFGNTSLPAEAVSWVDEALKQGAKQGRFPTSVPQRLPWEKAQPGQDEWVELATAGSTVWDGRGFGDSGLRPFELATVRLQNMVSGIIQNWGELKPSDDELLVQQGGAVVLAADGEAEYFFRDKGILTYVPMQEALSAARVSK